MFPFIQTSGTHFRITIEIKQNNSCLSDNEFPVLLRHIALASN